MSVHADQGFSDKLSPTGSADAELIATCHRFAEEEWDNWYRYCIEDDDPSIGAQYPAVDWATYHRIVATPATTPAGWHAKTLAYVALDRDAFDDPDIDRDPCTTFRASLLRDIVTPARDAIVARLTEKYGPLPDGYSANGMWIGKAEET